MKQENLQTNEIRLLPSNIINQIKAGEVIERPAHLLKELLENSIDANATQINLIIKQNGLELLSIKDNGDGISYDQLPLAFTRHATSKIGSYQDLFNLFSYGFRGEALASIASISKVSCTSFSQKHKSGGELLIEGGEQRSLIPIVRDQSGTEIIIKDLFYNTPVRFKFARSQKAEKNSLTKTLWSFLLMHPEISLTVRWDEKDKIKFPGNQKDGLLERINQLIKIKNFDGPLEYFKNEYDHFKIQGYFCYIEGKSALNKQFIFANERFIHDTTIHNIIVNVTKDKGYKGSSLAYFIFIDCRPNKIDVNVHPHKTTVRFSSPAALYSLVSHEIKGFFAKITESKNPADIPGENKNSFIPGRNTSYAGPKHGFNSNSIYRPDTQVSMTKLLGVVDNQFVIFSDQNKIKVIDLRKLLFILTQKWIEQDQVSEQDVLPLFISEPFTMDEFHFGQHQQRLASLGLEIDSLGPEKVIVRTIPPLLLLFENFQQVLQGLFLYIKGQSTLQTDEILDNYFNGYLIDSSDFPLQVDLDKILSHSSPESHCITELNKEKLANLTRP